MSVHRLTLDSLGLGGLNNEEVLKYFVIGGWIFTALQFVVTIFIPAPYGRHAKNAPKYLTFCPINAKLAWFFQECPSFFVPAILVHEVFVDAGVTQKILLSMFLIHYFQRSFIFPFLMHSGSGAPLLTTLSAFGFCCFNGFLQAHSILYVIKWNPHEYLTQTFLLGATFFLFGLIVNIDSDRRLRKLRSSSKPGVYLIPRGGFFKYVSAANYFGEICEWWGFAIAARLNLAALFFAGFTTLFLGLRGIQNHKFYLRKFKDEYPKTRKAVIPYIL